MAEPKFAENWVESLAELRIEPDEYPQNEWQKRKWMGRQADEKRAFAPWSSWDEPARCFKEDCVAEYANEEGCDCNAQYKWGWDGHYRTGEQLEVAFTVGDWGLVGACFIQEDEDEYMYIDLDGVVSSDGDLHPVALALLAHLGPTYCELSLSGTGLHALYKGELPAGAGSVSWHIDDEPWVDLDNQPAIELYDNKRLLITTGEHVQGTPASARAIDETALEAVLKANEPDKLQAEANESSSSSVDASPISKDDDPSPIAVEKTEDPEVVMQAISQLDARNVAAKTIVKEWTDRSRETHTFLPIWGSLDDRGTANIVNPDIWKDTGHEPGYGGPVAMAAIDLGLISHDEAEVGAVSGWEWVQSVRHLNELGFNVPYLQSAQKDRGGRIERTLDELECSWRFDQELAIQTWIMARESGRISEEASPPYGVIKPIVQWLTGEETNSPDEVSDRIIDHAEAVLTEMDAVSILDVIPE